MWPSREELLQLMSMDDTQWRDALCLQDLLSTLRQQRERNIDAKDVKGRRTGYFYAARSMFRYTFWTTTRPFYDAKRKSLWYLGWKGPRVCEDPKLDAQATYYILQKSHHLYVYSKAQPSKILAKFDMLKPEERQAFIDVRRLIAERYPPQKSARPKHKDLLRVQRLYNSGRQRGNINTGGGQESPLRR